MDPPPPVTGTQPAREGTAYAKDVDVDYALGLGSEPQPLDLRSVWQSLLQEGVRSVIADAAAAGLPAVVQRAEGRRLGVVFTQLRQRAHDGHATDRSSAEPQLTGRCLSWSPSARSTREHG